MHPLPHQNPVLCHQETKHSHYAHLSCHFPPLLLIPSFYSLFSSNTIDIQVLSELGKPHHFLFPLSSHSPLTCKALPKTHNPAEQTLPVSGHMYSLHKLL